MLGEGGPTAHTIGPAQTRDYTSARQLRNFDQALYSLTLHHLDRSRESLSPLSAHSDALNDYGRRHCVWRVRLGRPSRAHSRSSTCSPATAIHNLAFAVNRAGRL